MDTQTTNTPTDTWFVLQTHKRQTNALVGGLMVTLSYGFFFIWGFQALYSRSQWTGVVSEGQLVNTVVSFFIGIIIGAVVGYYLIKKFRKVYIYLFASILTIIAGGLFIPNWSTIVPVIISRYLGGIAQGIAMVTLLIHAPEISTKNMRGAVVVTISAMTATSILLGSMFLMVSALTSDYNYMNGMFGGLIILYAALGLIFLKFFSCESPLFLIKNNQEREAFDTIKRLRLATQDTYEIHRDFQELKDLINDEKIFDNLRFRDKGMLTFFRLLVLRILYAISTSMLLSRYLFAFSEAVSLQWGFSILSVGRFLIAMIVIYLVEKCGRRKLLFISNGVCGMILIISAFATIEGISMNHTLIALGVFAVCYEIFLGLGLCPISLVYISELLPLKTKAIAVMAILITENIVQILLVVIGQYVAVNTAALFIVIGALQICFGVYFYKTLPETKGLSLRDCLNLIK